jgi:hypothetical protein
MRSLWSRFVVPLRRAALGGAAAVVLVAMATPAFDAMPAQAGGLRWPSPMHLSQPSHQAPPGPQPPGRRQGSLTEFDAPGAIAFRGRREDPKMKSDVRSWRPSALTIRSLPKPLGFHHSPRDLHAVSTQISAQRAANH